MGLSINASLAVQAKALRGRSAEARALIYQDTILYIYI